VVFRVKAYKISDDRIVPDRNAPGASIKIVRTQAYVVSDFQTLSQQAQVTGTLDPGPFSDGDIAAEYDTIGG
jgi:hypothetical protein